MKQTIKIFPDNPAVANAFAKEFVGLLNSLAASQPRVTVALSGGSTPKLLFEVLATDWPESVPWEKIHFFWGDERCVPPTDGESNYGEAEKLLLSRISIPSGNVHRVLGEAHPEEECDRYGLEVNENVALNEEGLPSFDVMLLGMGSDGHTASIFPHEMEFLTVDKVCMVATHPESGQKRITVTGQVINASKHVFFLVTGEGKAEVLAEIMNHTGQYESYPTSHSAPTRGSTFYIDEAAGSKL